MTYCPLTYFRDNPEIEHRAFALHMHWLRGILPEPGGIKDQAADFSLVVSSVEYGVKVGRSRLQEIESKKSERDAKARRNRRSG